MRLMCVFIVSSGSRWTPRSRTTVTGLMTSSPTESVRSAAANLRRFVRLPNHWSSVFRAFSCNLRDAHQSWTSVMQRLRWFSNDFDFGYLTRSVKLLVVGEQMMADKVVRENVNDIFGIRDEFQWAEYWALWNATANTHRLGLNTVDRENLWSVCEFVLVSQWGRWSIQWQSG